ncbi:MAG: energy transducer TonB family protein [Boseongicola sp.]
MSSRSELILALTASCAVHSLALMSIDLPAGGVASGSNGQAKISITAASPGLREAIEYWDTSPEVFEVIKLAAAPIAELLTKPAGAWDDLAISDTQPDSIAIPELTAAPVTTSVATALPEAPRTASIGKLDAPALDGSLARVEPSNSLAELPDRQPDPMTSPDPLDLAMVASIRPPARPIGNRNVEPVPQQVAKGAGGGVTRGQSQNDVAAVAMSQSATKEAQAAWAAAIQRRIARHQRFPKRARGTGRVRLTMIIHSGGQMTDVRVAKSSGDKDFDRAAVAAAKKAAPFPAAPKVLNEPWYRVGQWVSFGR